jgi:hypothetical protein
MSRIAEHYLGDRPAERYPISPGYRAEGTSRDAAGAMKREAANLRTLVLAVLEESGPRGLTADEAAGKLNMTPFAIRPRFTELGPRHFNKIERTGERRWNASRTKAACWRIRR